MSLEATLHGSIAEIPAAEWDGCAAPEALGGGRPIDPFTTHRVLLALEESRSVGTGTGWEPRHIALRDEGRLVGVAPMYAKAHSHGEYVFDFAWADAWERAGGRYYPKLQMAVPFTPVAGRRLLAAPGEDRAVEGLLAAGVEVARRARVSSLHATFCTEAEARRGAAMGLLHRVGQQYHWEDEGYGGFEGFLAALSSRKRKTIRHERRVAAESGLRFRALTGAAIEPRHWDAMWAFYQDTGARKWGQPYLTRAFFRLAAERLADDVLLVMAESEGRPVAGALNLIGRDTLYGRYWGALEHHPMLHFEVCYYQAIDWALAHGLARVEAGAQGEHKIARGYRPVLTHSLHWIADERFRAAVADFLAREREAVGEEVEVLTALGPFRRESREEKD